MRIDVFFDAFPHPAKPNLETQLIEWQRQGHTLRLYSMGRVHPAVSTFPVTFIRTLREAPVRLSCRVLWRAMTRPARARRITRSERSIVRKLKLLVTDAQIAPGRTSPSMASGRSRSSWLRISGSIPPTFSRRASDNCGITTARHGRGSSSRTGAPASNGNGCSPTRSLPI